MPEINPLHFNFVSQILFDPDVANGYMKHYVPIPQVVSQQLEAAGITHVEGHLNDTPFRRLLHRRFDGSFCLKFGKIWLDQARVDVDMVVTIALAPDPEPDRIDLPEELASELMNYAQVFPIGWPSLQAGRRPTPIASSGRRNRKLAYVAHRRSSENYLRQNSAARAAMRAAMRTKREEWGTSVTFTVGVARAVPEIATEIPTSELWG